MAPIARDSFERGRRAVSALVAELPPVAPDGRLAKALAERPSAVERSLARLVPAAAFVLAARARGLFAAPAESCLARWLEPGSPLGELGSGVVRAALGAVTDAAGESDFVALEPEALGGYYEGTLGIGVVLARELTVVVTPKRRAGGAAVEVALGLESLAAAKARVRTQALRQAGLELGVQATRAAERAAGTDALLAVLTRCSSAKPRVVPAGRIVLLSTDARRRSGSHYTPRALAERVVATSLGPLLAPGARGDDVLGVRVADPAAGTGAFLLAAARWLTGRLLEVEAASGHEVDAAAQRRLRRLVAERCVFGVDRDATAIEVARLSLWSFVADRELPLEAFDDTLRTGDALTAAGAVQAGDFDWQAAFANVMAAGGFDACVGNPPWVSYAGRAAQPLSAERRRAYARFEAFAGYRNLQGLFVERAAHLLRPGGRLGFVLPSSMSELAGYRPTRRAHDRWCATDPLLPDLGEEAFDGVFQPCMVLSSTRRSEPLADVPDAPWPVERPDLDRLARALLEKLCRKALPAQLFGERGLQSSGEDKRHLEVAPTERDAVPLRAGADIEPFRLRPPSFRADPRWFGSRLRPPEQWQAVRFVVRQTARVPIAAVSDGLGFRNSLLAGFEDELYPAAFLVAYLNSTPIRWLHFVRHRDARQGMPQLKIGHLRATPAPASPALCAELARFGRELTTRARGISPSEQDQLDALVSESFELTAKERERLESFRATLGLVPS